MTVLITIPVQTRPFTGYSTEGLPSGMWAVTQDLTGDVSGGLRIISVIFAATGAPLGALLYSIEQLAVEDTDNNAKICDVLTSRMDPIQGSNLSPTVTLNVLAGSTIASLDAVGLRALKGWFIGRVEGPAAAGTLDLRVTNVNLETFTIFVQGYFWVPRAATVDGGPRRPVGGLYP